MLLKTAVLAVTFVLAACGYESRYEELVYDYDPVYCYKSIGAVQCYKEPKHADERRLVNYYGPAPSRYDRPDAPDAPDLKPPTDEIDRWVKEPEPVVSVDPVQKVAEAAAPKPAQAANQALAEATDPAPTLGFWEGIRRGVFGKPQLANTPKPAGGTGTL